MTKPVVRSLSTTLMLLLLFTACRKVGLSTREIEVKADGTTLYVRVTGDPKNDRLLIGVHGGPGNSSDYMISLEQLAGDGLSVALYDQRGTGLSSEPVNGYALSQYVEDIEAVRKAIGSETVDLFGHSWGGIVALRYAAFYPDRIRSLVLMGSGPPSIKDAHEAQAHLGLRILVLQEEGIIPKELPSTSEEYIRAVLPAFFSDAGFEMPDELENMSFNRAASDRTYAELGEWNFSSEINRLDHPVLMLWGEDDPFGMEMAEATMSALSHADVEFVVLKDCGHYWHECPQDFFYHIRNFLGLSSTP